MKEFWDERYGAKDYAYGETPNDYFKSALNTYQPKGKLLLPAEGEGRNAVYAAQLGLDVTAFDISVEGQKKANQLASKHQVNIDYRVGDFLKMDFPLNTFESLGLIYAHFPPPLKTPIYEKIHTLIKPGGLVILEGFSKNHIPLQQANPKVGGPKHIDFLFSEATIKQDFPNYDIVELTESEVELNEGDFHIGTAKVIRFIGRKK